MTTNDDNCGALRLLLNARRAAQNGCYRPDILSHCHTARDDAPGSNHGIPQIIPALPRRIKDESDHEWLYLLPSQGVFHVRGHGRVEVRSVRSHSCDESSFIIFRGGLAVARVFERRERDYVSLNPMVGAWIHWITVVWLDADIADHLRRKSRHQARKMLSTMRVEAFTKVVAILQHGDSVDYTPGMLGGRVEVCGIKLSAREVMRACGLSPTDINDCVREASACWARLRLPADYSYGVQKPHHAPRLPRRTAFLPYADRRRATAEVC
jgi:hypothetical protein